MKNGDGSGFPTFWWRVTMTHMVAYFAAGLVAWNLLSIRETYDTYLMSTVSKPVDSPWLAAATVLQVVTGLVWSVALWPFRQTLLGDEGWWKLWVLLVGLSILGTESPAPGSIDGVIYLTLPIREHLKCLPEVLLQTLLSSWMLHYWYRKPRRAWSVVSIVFLAFFTLMTAAVFLSPRP